MMPSFIILSSLEIQANTCYIFLGFGFGLVMSGTICVHDDMLLAACLDIRDRFSGAVEEFSRRNASGSGRHGEHSRHKSDDVPLSKDVFIAAQRSRTPTTAAASHASHREAKEAPAQPQPHKRKVSLKKTVKIGRPGYRVTKQFDPETKQRSLLFQIEYPEIEDNTKPRHRFMSSFEQKIQPFDKRYQYLLFAAEPYEIISFKVPSTEIDKSTPNPAAGSVHRHRLTTRPKQTKSTTNRYALDPCPACLLDTAKLFAATIF
ncbi:PREDICTED: uncharacterized protein LOC109185064 [Ipomoea nil]|uniref:uncharacterized protein LOC109185064 n=1 Tax=Ipomoea nil TaxID=35883 RepID=UPI000900B9E8|nr:PREDICTED: uncharacterized protein LOC109185064 [Ipomoea nil]